LGCKNDATAVIPPNFCEDFGLFPSGKALTTVSEKASRRDTRRCSHKISSVTQTLRIFGMLYPFFYLI